MLPGIPFSPSHQIPQDALQPDQFVISPSPVLWAQELQVFNEQPGQVPVWRELALRARQRGTKLINGRDWVGPVLIPSGVIGFLLEKKRLEIPTNWRSMPRDEVTRFVALLHAWQTERLIYDFSGLAAEIVLNSQAKMPLTSNLFTAIPAHAIYIDFESIDFRERAMIGGFFVGLNVDDHGQLELVLAEDRFDSIKVHTLALSGHTVDEAMQTLLSRARRKGSAHESQELADFIDRHLHVLLSAVMMVCSSHMQAAHVQDGVSCSSGHGLWTRLRIHAPFTDSLTKAYAKALHSDRDNPPVVVGEWVEPPLGTLANLRCSIGTRQEWSNVPGLPLSLRKDARHEQASSIDLDPEKL